MYIKIKTIGKKSASLYFLKLMCQNGLNKWKGYGIVLKFIFGVLIRIILNKINPRNYRYSFLSKNTIRKGER